MTVSFILFFPEMFSFQTL